VPIKTLKSYNKLKRNTVYIGQKIKLPNATSKVSSKPRYHKVRRGDTLSEIAQKYNVSIRYLKSANKLRSENIQLGQRLKVSG